MNSISIDTFFESLVLPVPRPYAQRTASAQKRVTDLLRYLGNPHHQVPCIHLVGSKGKGSTALFTESILETAGLKTATFTSPHLEHWCERFRIAGAPIDETALLWAINKIHPHVAHLRELYPNDPPTFFDSLTAIGFLLFAEAGVDLGIIEAGIGARLDATLVCRAIVACVTSIELEHTDKLGPTLEDIAREKAAVIRRQKPVVIGPLTPAAQSVLIETAQARLAPFARLGHEFHAEVKAQKHTGSTLLYEGHGQSLQLRLAQPGPYLAMNGALALECVIQTQLIPTHEALDAAQKALPRTRLPARLEIFKTNPVVLVDAAHTALSISQLSAVLETLDTNGFLAVLSVAKTKDVEVIFSPLRSIVSRVIATQADPSRSISAQLLAARLAKLWPREAIRAVDQPTHALTLALEEQEKCSVGVCVTGSVYLAGMARGVLRKTVAWDGD